MKSGKIIFILIGLIILISFFLSRSPSHKSPSTQSQDTEVVERKFLLLSFEDFNGLMGGNDHLSAEQRKRMFERYQGRYVRWWGEVEEVIKEISGDYTLRVRHSQTAKDFEVSIRFDKSKREKLLMLKRGGPVNYMGKLAEFDPQLGYYLEDGDIE
jgi:hypothetical protein